MPYDAQHNVTAKGSLPQQALPVVTAPRAVQATLGRAVACSDVGVHSGQKVTMRIAPAPEGHGIVFVRTDLKNGARAIPALWNNVVDTKLCTVIANSEGGRVATVEHLMAALYASEIDNAIIEIDGGEVPVMDGSSAPFMAMIEDAGVREQTAPRRFLDITGAVEIWDGAKYARLSPSAMTRFNCEIDFESAAIGTQRFGMALTADEFREEISQARTFGFFEEIEQLQKMGLARGGSLDNAVVIKGGRVLNHDGLRYDNEFVRHKLLDAVGDIALAGAPIRGQFDGYCTGHALNNRLLRVLFADKTAWRFVNNSEAA